jgi:hypothetical protein
MDDSVRAVLDILARRMVADIEAAVLTRAAQLAVEEPEFELDLAWKLWDSVHQLESRMRIEWDNIESADKASRNLDRRFSSGDLGKLRAQWLLEAWNTSRSGRDSTPEAPGTIYVQPTLPQRSSGPKQPGSGTLRTRFRGWPRKSK